MANKYYPFSLKENFDLLDHAKDVLVNKHDPNAAEKIRRIKAILSKEGFNTPNVAWLTGPELGFARSIIKETM